MSDVIRMKLLEADHPVGVKKKSRYILPPQDHVYGLPYKMDTEGVSIGIYTILIVFPLQLQEVGKCMNPPPWLRLLRTSSG